MDPFRLDSLGTIFTRNTLGEATAKFVPQTSTPLAIRPSKSYANHYVEKRRQAISRVGEKESGCFGAQSVRFLGMTNSEKMKKWGQDLIPPQNPQIEYWLAAWQSATWRLLSPFFSSIMKSAEKGEWTAHLTFFCR
jgi:hypothetical protein